jgi:hypothetical protein
MITKNPSTTERAVIVRTAGEAELARIADADVQAVIYEPEPLPEWLRQVSSAVESGAFTIPRTILQCVTVDEMGGWLAGLSRRGLAPDVRDALFDDVLGLLTRMNESTGGSRFMVRVFTAPPTTECGFHVDTVPRGAPPWGLLRVYNGMGTAFVDPDNVIGMAEFYRFVGRRERLEGERRVARQSGDVDVSERLEREITQLDRELPFLARPEDVHAAPAGAVVAFKHVDIGLYWTPHAKARAWIHCSPMCGAARLVVNVTCPEPIGRSRR